MTSFGRREFIGAGASFIVGSGKDSPSKDLAVEERTIAEFKAMMEGDITSRQIVNAYTGRIETLDRNLRSVVEMNPDAPAIANQMDAERKAGKVRGPLHGVPVLIKDNIDTVDKMKTTAGSLALMDAPAPKQDAFLVKRLRDAGAVILGKTNLSEWANFRSNKSSSGWSGRGGQTRNPYILDRNPCGSSSGTGAAISANLAAIGIGTETDGSIVCPSATCGIVGLKPTLGLVSRSGIIPIAHSQDTAGPMTRTVEDAAILLGVLVGADAEDSITSQANKGEKDYTKYLQKEGLRGMRIGVARQFWGRNDKIDRVMNPHLQLLKDQGAVLVDVEFPTLRNFGDAEYQVLLYEFKAGVNKYLAGRGGQMRTLKELIDFNERNADKEMPFFGQETFLRAEEKGDLTDRAYRLALLQSKVMTQEQGIDGVMDKHKLDAVVAPTGGVAWATDLVNGDCGYFGSSSLAAVAGYPNITVPAGYVQGLPAGISFFGRAFSEGVLIKAAYAFEQATKVRLVPKMLPTYA